MIKFLNFIFPYFQMRLSSRIMILLCALVSLSGVLISLYTQYVVKVNPCFSCYILRYSYLAILLVSIASLKANRLISLVMGLAVLIIAISAWGILGYAGYVPNPCIEVCPLGEDIVIGYALFILAFIGGLMEFTFSYLAARFSS